MADSADITTLRKTAYDWRLRAHALQQEASQTTDPAQLAHLLDAAGKAGGGVVHAPRGNTTGSHCTAAHGACPHRDLPSAE